MIEVKREKETVIIAVSLWNDSTFTLFSFPFNCGQEWIARLLKETLCEQLESKVVRTRQEAYGQGWDDARKRRARKTQFDKYL